MRQPHRVKLSGFAFRLSRRLGSRTEAFVLALLIWIICSQSVSAAAESVGSATPAEFLDPALRDSERLFPSSNLTVVATAPRSAALAGPQALLEQALRHRRAHELVEAEKLFVRLLKTDAPPEVHKTALLELAVLAHENGDRLKAQQIYA